MIGFGIGIADGSRVAGMSTVSEWMFSHVSRLPELDQFSDDRVEASVPLIGALAVEREIDGESGIEGTNDTSEHTRQCAQ